MVEGSPGVCVVVGEVGGSGFYVIQNILLELVKICHSVDSIAH